MPQRPFRFAVGASSSTGTSTRGGLIELAQTAESLGYATLLISDHLLDQFAPLPALAAIAQATTTLRLGTFVLNNDLRHPAVLAQELATVDLLARGDSRLASAQAGTSRSTALPVRTSTGTACAS